MKRIFATLAFLALALVGCHAQLPATPAYNTVWTWNAPTPTSNWSGCGTQGRTYVVSTMTVAAGTASCPAPTGANSGVVLIPGYADTSFDKSATLQSTSLASLSSTANNQYLDYGCGWASTSAITSITLTIGSGDYAANTKFMIYGIN